MKTAATGGAAQFRSQSARRLIKSVKAALLAFSCLGVLAGPVNAADLIEAAPEPPAVPPVGEVNEVHDWSGFYAGLHAGYLTGQTDLDWYTPGNPVNNLGPFDFSSAFGGAHAGVNWQKDSFVLGVEAALDYTPFSGGENGGLTTFKTFNARFEGKYMASLEGRAGLAMDKLLLYVTAGGAYLNASVRDTVLDVSQDYNLWGYTLGGGAEFAVTEKDSLRLDYKYAEFGQKFQDFNGAYQQALNPRFHMIGVGFSHKF
ncbi:outer membrane protein [Stappia sp. P2PMeth1]|uniref:outer membrane protein n=1 Tax=Stappia sp. P2PMeth1 TaxID=2003586 RepID=UPI0016470E33|nr:outer membrane beta-barrel protein [Stappia sp. P2PMeth1]